MTARASFVVASFVVVVIVVAVCGACNVFDFNDADIPCTFVATAPKTEDCPPADHCTPDGRCAKDVGEGEGEGEGDGTEGEGTPGEGEGEGGEGEGTTGGEGEGEGEGAFVAPAGCNDEPSTPNGTITIRALEQRCDDPEALLPGLFPTAELVCVAGECTSTSGAPVTADEPITPDPRGDGALVVPAAGLAVFAGTTLDQWAIEAVIRSDKPGAPLLCSGDCATTGLVFTDGAGGAIDGADLGFSGTSRAWRHFLCFATGLHNVDCYEEGEPANLGINPGTTPSLSGLTLEPNAVATSVRVWDLGGQPQLFPSDELKIAKRRAFGQAGLDVLNGFLSDTPDVRRDNGAADTTIEPATGAGGVRFLDVEQGAARAIVEVASGWPAVHRRLGKSELVLEDEHRNGVDIDLLHWSGSGSVATSGTKPPMARAVGFAEEVPEVATVQGGVGADIVGLVSGPATFSVFVQRPGVGAGAVQWGVANGSTTCTFSVAAAGIDDASTCPGSFGTEVYGQGWVRFALLDFPVDPSSQLTLVGDGALAWWPQLEATLSPTTPSTPLGGDAIALRVAGFTASAGIAVDATMRSADAAVGTWFSLADSPPGTEVLGFTLEDNGAGARDVATTDGASYSLNAPIFQAPFHFVLGLGSGIPAPSCVAPPQCFTATDASENPAFHDAVFSLDSSTSGASGPRHFTRVAIISP